MKRFAESFRVDAHPNAVFGHPTWTIVKLVEVDEVDNETHIDTVAIPCANIIAVGAVINEFLGETEESRSAMLARRERLKLEAQPWFINHNKTPLGTAPLIQPGSPEWYAAPRPVRETVPMPTGPALQNSPRKEPEVKLEELRSLPEILASLKDKLK